MADSGSGLDVSVVLPVRNGASTIGGQLDALARQRTSRSWELVVVDNGSTDETADVVGPRLEQFRTARLIDAGHRPGASFAKNRGAAVAEGPILLFCDADDEVDDHWIEELTAAVERHGFAGGPLDRRRFAGMDPHLLSVPVSQRLNRTADGTEFVGGANLGITRELFTRVGGFDEDFVGGNEDADLGLRVRALGVVPVFIPEAVVHYRDRDTLRATFRQYRRYGRTEPQLYAKHRTALPTRRPLDAVRFWGQAVQIAFASLRAPHRRVLVVRRLGRGLGRIEGSLRNHVLFW